MKRAAWCGLLVGGIVCSVAGCDKEETLPQPIEVGSATKTGKAAPAAQASGSTAEAPPAAPSKPSKCTPTAGEACFVGAELEHAAVLLHHLTGANVAVVGSFDKRIDGVIPTANAGAAFDALATQAELAHREINGIHYLGAADVLDKGTGAAYGFCRTPKSAILQRVLAGNLVKDLVEENGRRLVGTIDGEVTVALHDANACALLQTMVSMTGARGQVDAQALRILGDAAFVKSSRAAGTPCAPLDTDEVLRQPCHQQIDLAVVGTGKMGDTDVAILRRTGRIYEPVELVKPGEHVGDYHAEVGSIDAVGLKSPKGAILVTWSP